MQRASMSIPRALVLVLALVAASQSAAREVCDPGPDPAFAGSVTVDLTEPGRPPNALTGLPLGIADQTYEFVASGHTFRFTSLSGEALDTTGASGVFSWAFGASGGSGVTVTINPPVSAVGFVGYELDGCPGALYAGASGSQDASALSCNGGFPCPATSSSPSFFGAADIGSISTVDLTRVSSIFIVTRLVFVPSGAPPTDPADLVAVKEVDDADLRVLNGDPIAWDVHVDDLGPGDATDVVVIDLMPAGIFDDAIHDGSGSADFDPDLDVYTLREPGLAAGGGVSIAIDATVPAERSDFSCWDKLTNVVVASTTSNDPDLSSNLAVQTVEFDRAAVAGVDEDCRDSIDNDCNGMTDCADSPCTCRPSLLPLPGGTENPLCSGILGSGLVFDQRGDIRYCGPAPEHGCTVPRGECGGVTVPAACCDVSLFSNPQAILDLRACDVGVPGCVPRDPNWKESIPGVTIEGYGYTEPGLTMTYVLHYENVGDADALDVQVIDVLDPDLDDATLVVHDGGRYDPTTRTLVWTDPVVPPATPRQVSFEIDVRSDAPPATRVRNVGTIVFPNAQPPTRIDTNFVEHVIPDPSLVVAPELSVIACNESPAGSGLFTVELGNEGHGFAYDVTAEIVDPPPAVVVSDGIATFGHPDDPTDGSFTTVVPAATTTSADTVAFGTTTPGDPCPALTWRFTWTDLAGGQLSSERQEAPDRDRDAVADADDNCPDEANSDQADEDGDGVGDACDAPPSEPERCDVDADGDVDAVDVDSIFAARGEPAAGPDDPRDANRDGLLTVNDARLCVLECTLEGCASPPVCGLIGLEPLVLLGLARLRGRRRSHRARARRPGRPVEGGEMR